MKLGRKKIVLLLVAVSFFISKPVFSVYYESGAGIGFELTDNATLVKNDTIDELISTGYVGARFFEENSALTYDAAATVNVSQYANDSFEDQQIFNLIANSNWVAVENRLDLFLRDVFSQRTINAFDLNTPNNLQNSNAFTFGGNIKFPISGRQNFIITPLYNQFYFEELATDNKQYTLSANWVYQLFHLTSVGLSFNIRKIDYTEENEFGLSIDDIKFTNLAIVFSGERAQSVFTLNLGQTNVKRDNGQETDAFSGYFNWLTDLSSHSTFETRISTALTDSTRVGLIGGLDEGSLEGIQVTTDVIRNSFIFMEYFREDAIFNTRLTARRNKIKYSV